MIWYMEICGCIIGTVAAVTSVAYFVAIALDLHR
jgi:hypothetical protein